MKSIKKLYKIGNGPSSSHTMGPKLACEYMLEKNKNADMFVIYLYGSLAHTGKGHLTDLVINDVFKNVKHKIIVDLKTPCKVHPNQIDIEAYKNGEVVDSKRIYSVGGGVIKVEGEPLQKEEEVYLEKNFGDIKKYVKEKNISLAEYVYEKEGEDIKKYLSKCLDVMFSCIEESLQKTGMLPGKLNLKRKAKEIYLNKEENENLESRKIRLLTSYAIAVAEESACGGVVVTSPTCGASGVLPAVLYYMYKNENVPYEKIVDALAVAGIIGNVVKHNASISGAEAGCQAEIGTACSMAAAARAYVMYNDIDKIEDSAEIAMEHHLGLTCDPIYGYVQIPCIQRNAVAAIRSVDSATISNLYNQKQKISFDMVVDTMYETGKDLKSHYRETSTGGLAKKYCRNKYYNKEIE